MIAQKAPSFRWLMAHEIRLRLRFVFNRRKPLGGLKWVLTMLGVLQLVALAGVWAALPLVSDPEAIRRSVFWVIVFTIPIMLGAAIDGTIESFFKRDDLDLLLSSPLPPRRILLVRWLAIAFNTLVTPLFLILPIANAAVMLVSVKLIFSYVVLCGLALVMTAAGTIVASALIMTAGPRVARRIGSVLSTLAASLPVLGPQLSRYLPDAWQAGLSALSTRAIGPDGPWIVVAFLDGSTGDAFKALIILIFCLSLFFGVSHLLVATGIETLGRISSAGAPITPKSHARPFERRFLAKPMVSIQQTYWRLMTRRPGLTAQLFGQCLPLVPILVGLAGGVRLNAEGASAIATASIVFVLAQLASVGAAALIEVDDAAEFVQTAPRRPRQMEAAKIVAASSGPVILTILLLPLFLFINFRAALALAVMVPAASLSLSVLNLRYPRPWKSRSLDSRPVRPFLLSVSETLLGVAWATVAFMAAIWDIA